MGGDVPKWFVVSYLWLCFHLRRYYVDTATVQYFLSIFTFWELPYPVTQLAHLLCLPTGLNSSWCSHWVLQPLIPVEAAMEGVRTYVCSVLRLLKDTLVHALMTWSQTTAGEIA